MPIDREQSVEERSLIDHVSGICAGLPETVSEVDGFGHTAFRVAGKPFVLIGGGAGGQGSLSVKTDPATQERLVAEGLFFRTPGLGRHGWVTIWGDAAIDWTDATELIRDAWLRVAPKRVARDAAR